MVESATVRRHRSSKGGDTHSVSVRYRYTVAAVEYVG